MTTKAVRDAGLDKFYTIPEISQKCIDLVGSLYAWNSWALVVEPSAGNGSFLIKIPLTLPYRIGIDISPEHPEIQKQDFLTYTPSHGIGLSDRILVIGNPPFGKVSSLAVKFFNHAAKWASVIAFIIPRTFRRISLQNKLDTKFHLIHDIDIPTTPCSFQPPMMVKCCFQIWEKKVTIRPKLSLVTHHDHWDFLDLGPIDTQGQPTVPEGADFAIRAYGGKCGEIIRENLSSLRPKSWHWIKSKIDVSQLVRRFEGLDYSISKDTARQNSIGRGDLVQLYTDFLR
jgi:predicted RNA methylase